MQKTNFNSQHVLKPLSELESLEWLRTLTITSEMPPDVIWRLAQAIRAIDCLAGKFHEETLSRLEACRSVVAEMNVDHLDTDPFDSGVRYAVHMLDAVLNNGAVVERGRCLTCGGPTPCYHDHDTDDHKRAVSE